jgi:Methyl-accepting chemotaxis protein (MCP) signalling domain/Four helix bundle sensory module for signal transduction
MKIFSISKKLYLSFGTILALMIILGGFSIFRLNQTADRFVALQTDYLAEADAAGQAERALLAARRDELIFLASKDQVHTKKMNDDMKGLGHLVQRLKKGAAHLDLKDASAAATSAGEAIEAYQGAFDAVGQLLAAQGDRESGIIGEMSALGEETGEAIRMTGWPQHEKIYATLRQHEKDYLQDQNPEYHRMATEIVRELPAILETAQIGSGIIENIMTPAAGYIRQFDALVANAADVVRRKSAMQRSAADIETAVGTIKATVMKAVSEKQVETLEQKKDTVRWMILIMGIAILLGAGLSYFSVRSVTGPLNRAIDGLGEGAGQVTAASDQIAFASQSLAEGSSEQAASIEKTSASLEKMSAMTRQNADNAGQADALMKDANRVVGQASTAMSELTASIEEISQASEETQKIIKTIDEIAFQTNLLALNAAVEAARAGEAGAGFAVVADEVRNLAMRSADAAQNTAELIEGTVKKVESGTGLVARTNTAFFEVTDSSAKVGKLVAEIASASREQAQGIGQVNTEVIQMEKITRQNAAGAEESASAAEEMNAQAESMKAFVGELQALMGGRCIRSDNQDRPPRASAGKGRGTIRPESLMPPDDGDFSGC